MLDKYRLKYQSILETLSDPSESSLATNCINNLMGFYFKKSIIESEKNLFDELKNRCPELYVSSVNQAFVLAKKFVRESTCNHYATKWAFVNKNTLDGIYDKSGMDHKCKITILGTEIIKSNLIENNTIVFISECKDGQQYDIEKTALIIRIDNGE